jgi:hypothetical protein
MNEFINLPLGSVLAILLGRLQKGTEQCRQDVADLGRSCASFECQSLILQGMTFWRVNNCIKNLCGETTTLCDQTAGIDDPCYV